MKKFLFVTVAFFLLTHVVYSQCEPISSFPWAEGFENIGTELPPCWEQEILVSPEWHWNIVPKSVGTPATAHGGISKAQIFLDFLGAPFYKTRLITPVFDLSVINDPKLYFWHTQTGPCFLMVYYRNSPSGEWILLESSYIWGDANIPDWQEEIILLPEKSDYYQIAFTGMFNGGGIADLQLDDISIGEERPCGVTILSNPPGMEGESNIIPCGTEITVCAAPHEGYAFINWTEDNIEVSTDECFSFIVTGMHTLVANFEVISEDDFIPVINITSVPTATTTNVALELTATIEPSNATKKTIIWTITDADTTKATIIDSNVFKATANGTIIVTATIIDGIAKDENYTQEFSITVTDSVNIVEILANSISIYPNPTTGELRIENGKLRMENVEIFDIYGRKVEAKFPSNELEGWQPQADGVVFNISHLSAGIYFVKIITEQGEIVKKVVKQ